MPCVVLVLAGPGAETEGEGGVAAGRGQEGGGAGVGGEVGAEAKGPDAQGVEKEVKHQNGGFAQSQEGSKVAPKRGTLRSNWLSTLCLIRCSPNKRMFFLLSTMEGQWREVLSLLWTLATERLTSISLWKSRAM